jgi:hypothetical protein
MSNSSTRIRYPAGDFISENAVRGVFGRRRPCIHPTTIQSSSVPAANAPADGDGVSLAPAPRPLRRWSVAELLRAARPHQ